MGLIVVRGGGDLASGVALRLHRAGLQVAITELPQPLAVRRTVSSSEAVVFVALRLCGSPVDRYVLFAACSAASREKALPIAM